MTPSRLFPEDQRDIATLLQSGLTVITAAFSAGAKVMLPLFSGGHDSLSACFLASQHPRFEGNVFHIDTGIGAKATRCFVEGVCKEQDWRLHVFRSNFSYEKFVSRLGFPGPGSHQWIYNKLKDRCISAMAKGLGRVVLVTGCRQHESTRRMGHVQPLKIGETSKKTGITRRTNRAWCAPCWDWTADEQRSFMNAFALPRNPIKESPLAMSGECFCGAFARPDELSMIRRYAPDVAAEIDRVQKLVPPSKGTVWGVRSPGQRGVMTAITGPLCSSCDVRAAASGLLFEEYSE